ERVPHRRSAGCRPGGGRDGGCRIRGGHARRREAGRHRTWHGRPGRRRAGRHAAPPPSAPAGGGCPRRPGPGPPPPPGRAAAHRARAGRDASMIARLAGTLVEKSTERLVVDVGGVGYLVHVSLQTFIDLPPAGASVRLLVHTEVREDAIELFGFAESREQALFHLLRKVKGLGPRTSLA